MTGTYGADRHDQRRLVKRSVKFGRACQPFQDQIDRRSLKVGFPFCGAATGGLPRAGADPAGGSRRPRDSTTHTALSQAGEILADYARRLFALAHEAEEALADVRAVGRGRLLIGASTTIGTYLLPAVVAEFWRRRPRIELLVEIENTEQIHRRLAGHELDVGLTEGFVEEEELDAEVFHRDELVVIASPAHPLAGKARVPLRAVQQEPFVLREPGSGSRAVEERTLARLKLPVRVVMALGSTEAIKRVVAEGVGLAIVSRLAVRAECAAGTLAVLPVAGLHIERAFNLVRRQGRRDGPALQAFCGVLQEMIARWSGGA